MVFLAMCVARADSGCVFFRKEALLKLSGSFSRFGIALCVADGIVAGSFARSKYALKCVLDLIARACDRFNVRECNSSDHGCLHLLLDLRLLSSPVSLSPSRTEFSFTPSTEIASSLLLYMKVN